MSVRSARHRSRMTPLAELWTGNSADVHAGTPTRACVTMPDPDARYSRSETQPIRSEEPWYRNIMLPTIDPEWRTVERQAPFRSHSPWSDAGESGTGAAATGIARSVAAGLTAPHCNLTSVVARHYVSFSGGFGEVPPSR